MVVRGILLVLPLLWGNDSAKIIRLSGEFAWIYTDWFNFLILSCSPIIRLYGVSV